MIVIILFNGQIMLNPYYLFTVCIYVRTYTSTVYHFINQNNQVHENEKLSPVPRTLRDYRQFSSHCQTGFMVLLLQLIKQRRPSHLARYVFLLINEMYIKEGLVYEMIGDFGN